LNDGEVPAQLSAIPVAAPVASPGIATLFTAFMGVGLMGFGGVLPLARRMLVEERRWLAPGEFLELLAVCQFLPGGNVMNLAVGVGLRFRGIRGGLAALIGLLAAPVGIIIALGAIYGRFQDNPTVHHVFAGLAAAAGGLVVAMAIRLAAPLRRKPVAAGLATLCFLAVGLLRLPLPLVILAMVPLSMLVLWACRRRFPL